MNPVRFVDMPAGTLEKALREEWLTDEEILYILSLEDESLINRVFEAARQLRARYFGEGVFLYGFLYISTYCRNDCRFCFYRRSNTQSLRYRKEETQILEAARALAGSGVHLIDLTMGEDPRFLEPLSSAEAAAPLVGLVRKVKETVDMPIMVSPGVVSETLLKQLKAAGADWYACYQETHSRELFRVLRPGQDYDLRYRVKSLAHGCGLLTEEGILAGVGEGAADLLKTFHAMRELGSAQVRVMNLVPREGTPMSGRGGAGRWRELLCIALLRILFPRRLIPATLDVEGLDGLSRRLAAGANVVTSLVPPGLGLAGVARSRLDIDNARRTVEHVLPVLKECGLRSATLEEYQNYINKSPRPTQ